MRPSLAAILAQRYFCGNTTPQAPLRSGFGSPVGSAISRTTHEDPGPTGAWSRSDGAKELFGTTPRKQIQKGARVSD